LKTRRGEPIVTNVFLPRKKAENGPTNPDDERSPYQDRSIEALQAPGVLFLTCHTALEEQGRALVKAGHAPPRMNRADVAADILTHVIPGAIVVPSMVATIAVLQRRFGYTYITVQS
jgi:intracellular sulfur oxidation DsrE/DsrF family protein